MWSSIAAGLQTDLTTRRWMVVQSSEPVLVTMEYDDGWWSLTIPAWDVTTYVVDDGDALEAIREAVAFELDVDPAPFQFELVRVASAARR